ncbi:MAG: C4-dicarboxylate transporter substrate-binding protein [Deltaproteobacteria bacterium]|nr:C4-dicarboxylate transporter substrate-binding protein [Deltaproteobacteria bacterium]
MNRTEKRIPSVIFALLLISALSLVSGYSTGTAAELPKSVTLIAGRVGSSNYAFATGVTSLITKTTGIKAVPEGGTYGKNLILLHRKEAEFIFCNSDLAYNGARGLEEFKGYGNMNARLLFSGSTSSPMVFVTRRDANIKSVTDLKGKKVMCFNPGNSAFHKGADVLFEAVGMKRADVQALSFSGRDDGDMAIKEGRIAAYIHNQIVTSVIPFMQELNMQVPIRLVSAPEKNLDTVLTKCPSFRKDILPAKVYGEMTDNKDLAGVGFLEIVLCQKELPDELVYRVMKAIFDNLPELYSYTPMAKIWTQSPLISPVLPYHPGAIKYYKEKKLWTETQENKQKQLLSEAGDTK